MSDCQEVYENDLKRCYDFERAAEQANCFERAAEKLEKCKKEKKGFSAGEIAGIVIGSLVFGLPLIGAIIFLFYFLIKRFLNSL